LYISLFRIVKARAACSRCAVSRREFRAQKDASDARSEGASVRRASGVFERSTSRALTTKFSAAREKIDKLGSQIDAADTAMDASCDAHGHGGTKR
jgi:hypothetical protein